MRRIFVATALFVAVMAPARADFQEGYAAFERGDYATAFREMKPIAEQGSAAAQFNLGILYDNGRGVPQDHVEAVKWFRAAAKQGYANAQFNLGLMYSKGRGVLRDYVEAHMWLNLAAAQGSELAKKNRDIVADKMTSDQIVEAQRLAREWKPKKQ